MLLLIDEGPNNKVQAALPNKSEKIIEFAYNIVSKKMNIITCFNTHPWGKLKYLIPNGLIYFKT